MPNILNLYFVPRILWPYSVLSILSPYFVPSILWRYSVLSILRPYSVPSILWPYSVPSVWDSKTNVSAFTLSLLRKMSLDSVWRRRECGFQE